MKTSRFSFLAALVCTTSSAVLASDFEAALIAQRAQIKPISQANTVVYNAVTPRDVALAYLNPTNLALLYARSNVVAPPSARSIFTSYSGGLLPPPKLAGIRSISLAPIATFDAAPATPTLAAVYVTNPRILQSAVTKVQTVSP